MEEMSTGEKIARVIIQHIQEDSGIEFAVTSQSIEFIVSILSDIRSESLNIAGKYLNMRADQLLAESTVTNDNTKLFVAYVLRDEANNIRALIYE